MNLENTKVYTTDPEVIRKYAELCGKKFECEITSSIGVYNCDTYKKINDFMMGSPVDIDSDFKQLTADQINALYDEKFGEVEKAPNSSEWKNGDLCTYDGSEYIFVGMTPTFNDVSCIIFDHKNGIEHVSVNKLRKPKTPQQREERERLEAIKEMAQTPKPCGYAIYDICAQLYDAGYRKQKDGE